MAEAVMAAAIVRSTGIRRETFGLSPMVSRSLSFMALTYKWKGSGLRGATRAGSGESGCASFISRRRTETPGGRQPWAARAQNRSKALFFLCLAGEDA